MNAQRLGLALLLVGLLFAPALPNRLLAAPLPASAASLDTQLDPAWTFARQQLLATANRLSSTQFPNYTSTSGSWVTTDAKGWTSGFFPGSLWLADEQHNDPALRSAAEKWTAALEGQKNRTDTHDVGFMIFNSFGNAYRRTGNDAYRQVLLTAAASLATRYDPDVGCIKSWDGDEFRVLIDNMMNLELLFWAARNGGKHEWYDMAVSHALKTRANHVRADGSTYQIVIYDPVSGAVTSKATHQGYNSESTWSRGQAWAIYGFSMAYRETGDVRFRDTARAAADYFLASLPADHVPYWDFELPSVSGEPRDSSAAAVSAAGLLELSTLVDDATASQNYRAQAAAILTSLTGSGYLAKGTSNQAILLHGTPNKNQDRYDRGTSYGDYYLLQALLRYQVITPPTVTPTTPTVTPTPTTPTATPAYALRLNAGGTKQTLSGVEWQADSSYAGGSVYEVAGAAIAGTSADVLYQSERNGTSFSYAIALPANGSYRVRLHFAELYWTSVGKRVFSVNLEGGTPELSNYDIYAAVGYRTATVQEYSVAVSDGKLDITFSASVNRAKISAIEVLR